VHDLVSTSDTPDTKKINDSLEEQDDLFVVIFTGDPFPFRVTRTESELTVEEHGEEWAFQHQERVVFLEYGVNSKADLEMPDIWML